MNSGIYRITNLVDGKVYIGQSVNIPKRLSVHKLKLRNNIHDNEHLQNAWNKYGEDAFLFEKIIDCAASDLDGFEISAITAAHSNDNRHGYNIMSGGQSRHNCPDEIRRKISAQNKGRLKGRTFTEAHKKAMSQNWHNVHSPLTSASIERIKRTRAEHMSGCGERNGNAVISDDEAKTYITMMIAGKNPLEIASEYNISANTAYNLFYGKTYKHIHVEGRDELKSRARKEFEKRIDQAVNLFLSGKSQNEIAHILNMSRNTIRRELVIRGIDYNRSTVGEVSL